MPEEQIKNVLRRMPYGFYSLTTRHENDVNAMVINWVTQASFEPHLMAIGLQKSSFSHNLVMNGRVFTINLFNKSDVEKIKPFTKSRKKNPEKMATAQYEPAPVTGCPVLAGAAAYLECRVVSIVDIGGDHDIVIGQVINAEQLKPGEVEDTLSLLDLGWSYAG